MMMQEMLLRRFKKISAPDNGSTKGDSWVHKPDLVLIDGGKGHLTAAKTNPVKAKVSWSIESIPPQFEAIGVHHQGLKR